MALNSSGPISIAGTTAGQSIQIELGGTGSTQMSLNCASVRTLAGVPTGAIVMPTNFYGKSNTVPFGCATYGTAGTYTFTVPTGVTKISVVCVGAGGGARSAVCNNTFTGAGGGALSFTNCIPVTAGESLTVIAGAATAILPNTLTGPGADSSVSRGATILVLAQGGRGGSTGVQAGGAAASGTGATKYSGGSSNGGVSGSGGGAAGYAGNGGTGVNIGSAGNSGSGGGGGSGGTRILSGNDSGGGGGGVGLIVQGPSGAGGVSAPSPANQAGGGGSGGAQGCRQNGGAYGGGGGSHVDSCGSGAGARGGVRIIYGGTGKSYPSNSAP